MKLRFRLHSGEDCDLMRYVTVQFVIWTTFTITSQKATVQRMMLTAKERNYHYVWWAIS